MRSALALNLVNVDEMKLTLRPAGNSILKKIRVVQAVVGMDRVFEVGGVGRIAGIAESVEGIRFRGIRRTCACVGVSAVPE